MIRFYRQTQIFYIFGSIGKNAQRIKKGSYKAKKLLQLPFTTYLI